MSDEVEVIAPVVDAPADVVSVVDAAEPVVEVEPIVEVEEELPPPMERVGVGSLIERTPRGWMAHLMYGGARRIHGEGATIEDAVKAALGVVA